MTLRRGFVGVAVLALSASASAQSSVTLYGIVDVAVERINNATPSGSGLTRMASATGSTPSRLGLRGSEDLGGGLKAEYTLEMGIGVDAGVLNQGGRLFGRQSWVGLTGQWGTLSLGRQYTMLSWALGASDVLGGNIYSTGMFDAYLPNARTDNSIAYRGTFGGFTAGANYSFGRDTVNAGPSPVGTNCPGESPADSSQCRQWSAMLKYDAPTWGVAGAVDELSGGPGAFGGLTNSSLKDRRSTLNGYVRFGDTKIGGGVIMRDNDAQLVTPRSNLWYLGLTQVFTYAFKLDAQVARIDFKSGNDDANLFMLRTTYSLSKRTSVYAGASHVRNSGRATYSASGGQAGGNPPPGGNQTAVALGVSHTF